MLSDPASHVDAPETRTIVLPTGTVRVSVDEADWPLDALCGFAARDNPRRGFLVVSRVLGRHVPVAPSTMRRSARDLAARIPADLPGPVLVVGLAETAICLGQTIHEELRAQTGRDDVLYLHTTRQQIDAPLLTRFEEPHSHASAHLLYRPQVDGFDAPRALVLIDDEVSTGTTLGNLAAALVACWPGVEAIAVATLADWSGGGAWCAAMPRPTRRASLLSGRLAWTPAADVILPSRAFDAAAVSLGTLRQHHNYGRLGLREPVADPPATALPHPSAAPLRIVGTGEFTYLPFRLAERIEQSGRDVVVQATTRSPARLGGAMASMLRFADNYATGVTNFLYNADPGDGRETWLCHETPAGSVDPALVASLDAMVLGWGEGS